MFEKKLAWRYIKTQKRHSILTVCSIAIALALMTMLFTLFSTVIGCFRDIAHKSGEYHITIGFITKEQAEAVARYVGDSAECKIQKLTEPNDSEVYKVSLLFDEYIGDRDIYETKLLRATGIDLTKDYFEEYEYDTTAYMDDNDMLITLDMIDLRARLQITRIFAVFYLFIIFFAVALRLLIDTAFEISSKERERQFGVLQSIGATPRQAARIITVEGLILSAIGIPIGTAAGVGLGYAAYRAVLSSGIAEAYLSAEEAAGLIHFHVSPLLLLIGAVTGLVWVLLSAYGTGMRIVRMSPVQAISGRNNTVKKVKRRSLFGAIFGWTGKLASRNNMRQKKRYMITVVSLTVSITLFALTGMVLDFVKTQYQEDLEGTYGTTSDFGFWCRESESDMSYREMAALIANSGYFDNIYMRHEEIGEYWLYHENLDDYIEDLGISEGAFGLGRDEVEFCSLLYYDRAGYEMLFDGEPPMSYDELTASGGYIHLRDGYYYDYCRAKLPESGTVTIEVSKMTALTAEECVALFTDLDPSFFSKEDEPYYIPIMEDEDFEIVCAADVDRVPGFTAAICLIGSLEALEQSEHQPFGEKINAVDVYCDLAKGASYFQVKDYEMEYLENTDGISLAADQFGERAQINSTISAIRIILTFLIIMIALIAIVNMVNILSTGILNRRGEIAAMQSIGMTQRQLYKMTAVECLQYALGSGVISVVFCELLIGGTRWLMEKAETLEEFGYLAGYGTPLPKIALAVGIAFAVALIASLLPLRRMQKTSLVEQIRSVD